MHEIGLCMTFAVQTSSYCLQVFSERFNLTFFQFQLGHEPLEPVLRRNVYFRKQWQYPSVFQYCEFYIKFLILFACGC